MTNSNFKKTETILFATIIVAMMIPLSTYGGGIALAEKNTGYTKAQMLGLIEKHNSQITKQLTTSELDNIDEKVKLDKRIQSLLKGGSLTRVAYSHYVNIVELDNNPNTVVDDVMNYVENGKSLTVLVDGATYGVLDLQENPIGKPLTTTHASIIDDYYDNNQIDGIRLDFNSPNFTPISGDGATFILVNALKAGSTIGDECISGDFPGTYWAQSGEELDSSGPELVWADTTTNCFPQDFTTPTVRPSIGNNLDFEIQVNSSGRWVLYGLNVSTGGTWSHPQTVSGNTYFDTTQGDTNVFFENPNPTSNHWAAQYNTNPVMADGYKEDPNTGIWDYWPTENLAVYDCTPGGQPISSYETGTLKAGTLTYNVNNIQTYCGTGS
ncbi:MAG: hypothetical protein ACREA8_03820 [Nitrosotalea sp.]